MFICGIIKILVIYFGGKRDYEYKNIVFCFLFFRVGYLVFLLSGCFFWYESALIWVLCFNDFILCGIMIVGLCRVRVCEIYFFICLLFYLVIICLVYYYVLSRVLG